MPRVTTARPQGHRAGAVKPSVAGGHTWHAFARVFGVSRPITDESHATIRTMLTESLAEIRLEKVSYICNRHRDESATAPSVQATNTRQSLLLRVFQGVCTARVATSRAVRVLEQTCKEDVGKSGRRSGERLVDWIMVLVLTPFLPKRLRAACCKGHSGTYLVHISRSRTPPFWRQAQLGMECTVSAEDPRCLHSCLQCRSP